MVTRYCRPSSLCFNMNQKGWETTGLAIIKTYYIEDHVMWSRNFYRRGRECTFDLRLFCNKYKEMKLDSWESINPIWIFLHMRASNCRHQHLLPPSRRGLFLPVIDMREWRNAVELCSQNTETHAERLNPEWQRQVQWVEERECSWR